MPRRLITLASTLIMSQKPNSVNVLLYFVLWKITTNALTHRTQFISDKSSSYLTVRELDFALGNHALRAQPTEIIHYSSASRLVSNL